MDFEITDKEVDFLICRAKSVDLGALYNWRDRLQRSVHPRKKEALAAVELEIATKEDSFL